MKKKSGYTFLLIFMLQLCCMSVHAESLGTIEVKAGEAFFSGPIPIPIRQKTTLNNGSIVKTGKDSSALAVYNDGSRILLRSDSLIIFKQNMLTIKRGASTLTFQKQNSQFRISTPEMLMGLIGTELEVTLPDKETSIVKLHEGSIWVEARFGNKKKLTLEKGYEIKADRTGIVGTPAPFVTSDAEKTGTVTEIAETPEPESDNLEMEGPYSVRIMPMIDNPFRMFINNFSRLNGREFKFEVAQEILLERLEEGTYDISILVNGYENLFQVEVNQETDRTLKVVKFKRFNVDVSIGDMIGTKNRNEKSNFVKCWLVFNGKKVKVNLRNASSPVIEFGMDACYNGSNLEGGNVFYFIDELQDFPAVELEYTGSHPVKNRKFFIQLENTRSLFHVTFK